MGYALKEKPKPATPEEEQTVETSEAKPGLKLNLETRVLELETTLEMEKGKSDDFFRRLQYLQADFENYRKRAEKEMWDARRFGNELLLSELLVVNDELELAVQKAQQSRENPALLEGVRMVLKRLQNLLAKEGVQRIEGVGSKFTPDLHEAALKVPSDKEEGTIVEEIRPGYTMKGRVLRPSIVKVAEKQATVEAETQGSGEE